jgi:hypothetical protein
MTPPPNMRNLSEDARVLSRGLLSARSRHLPATLRAQLQRFAGENRKGTCVSSTPFKTWRRRRARPRVPTRHRLGAVEKLEHRTARGCADTRPASGIARCLRDCALADGDRPHRGDLPASAVAGTRYDERQMRVLDSEHDAGSFVVANTLTPIGEEFRQITARRAFCVDSYQ